jgi:chromosomal replication initiation ATPase DnaA
MRQTAMYLAHVAFGLTYTEIGQLFSRDRTTVAHACGVVEERRDDPIVDRALTTLEQALQLLRHDSS